jgi:voltage-gated potassium channel
LLDTVPGSFSICHLPIDGLGTVAQIAADGPCHLGQLVDLERDAKAANIKSFGDAVWWAITTVTTVGYGDRYPVTAGGRAVAAVLMIGGIALLGIVTAAIAAFFVDQNRGHGKSTTTESELLRRLAAIEDMLSRLVPNPLSTTERTDGL